MIAALMGCIGSLAGAFLVWGLGIISRAHGFGVPFLMIAGLAALGLVPVLLVRWDGVEVISPPAPRAVLAEVNAKG
jgi:hypothetical protein